MVSRYVEEKYKSSKTDV
uniref:Uncharacterized protein n=1 Tax=Arundo donax TaxID=35708 RepID=A0A0A8Y6U9_ARUDO